VRGFTYGELSPRYALPAKGKGRFPSMSDVPMTTLAKAGRYEIVGELGRGAMGVVYKATDPVIGRTVAVKTIKLSAEGTGLTRPELLARFQTEARAAGLLTHPNIVVVFDAGEEDGLYYIIMELVEGRSLQALLDDGHSFPLPRVLRIMEQACSALQFAHERNVVHRDIKPANLMLTGDDTVKVTDFGTAKILQFGTVQQTAHVMGTPSYMSPEQVKGRAVDGRSDIFSLGVMLYEMVAGEKPFPGQNITTVIYKIVNEEPVPPKQVNPTVHPGISAVVMRALAKDPDTRYQSCREMLEDLRNYRSLSATPGNPQSTMTMGSNVVNSTVALSPAGLRGVHNDDTAAISRSLSARAAHPGQTPALRRTGTLLQPVPEPKPKKSIFSTIFVALLLLGVIGYCANKLRPIYDDMLQHRKSAASASTVVAPPVTDGASAPNPAASTPGDDSSADNSDSASADAKPNEALAPVTPPVVDVKSTHVERAPVKKPESVLTAKAAEYKGRIEEAMSERGLGSRAKVQGVGNTLTLSGKLRPAEHGALLKFLRDAPAAIHLIDHIEYDDAPEPSPTSAVANPSTGSHPIPAPGFGAIHVVTDVIGAAALLHGSSGRVVNQCLTPCSFNNLTPDRYSLEVKKDGYQPIQTALQVKQGGVADQKLSLESLAKGLYVASDPPGADVFINGAKQSGQTPVTLPLAAGQYNLVLRLQGYDPYVGSVQVKENVQTQLRTKLNERSMTHVAWAQVNSDPGNAEIFVDGNSTGRFTPARIEVSAGTHVITLKLAGYRPIKRTVSASEGGTVPVNESLSK
jgi:eukaryotic-like serine/threonine-protein kinase